jgi:hypothetical protein
MVICGSYIFESSVSKDIKKGYNKEGGSKEGNDTFMSNTNCQGIEN